MTRTITIQPITAADLSSMEGVLTTRWGRLQKNQAEVNYCDGMTHWWDENGEDVWLSDKQVARDATNTAWNRACRAAMVAA